MSDSPLKTLNGLSLTMNEVSGTRASSWAAAVATEQGGTVGSTAGVNGLAALFVRADNANLVVAHSAAVQIGPGSWTIDGYVRGDVANQYQGLIEKGSELWMGWYPSGAQNHLEVHLDNDGLVFAPIVVDISAFTYFRISHNAIAHTVTVIVGAYSSTVPYVWAGAAGTANMTIGYAGGGFGLGYWSGALDDFCLWKKVLDTGEAFLRQNGLKYIPTWGTNPPYLYWTQTWSHFPANEPYVLDMFNYGGAATSESVPAGALPAGIAQSLVAGSMRLSGTPSALGTTTPTLRLTNADGDSDFVLKCVCVQHYPTGGVTVIPWQRFESAGLIGYDTFKRGGVASVKFVLAGGAPSYVSAMSLDPATGVCAHNLAFTPGGFSDGPVTVDIVSTPNVGDSRVVGQFSVLANAGGGLTSGNRVRYISPSGNDSTGTGTSINPYKTVLRACQDLQATFGDCANCTIYLANGDYVFGWSTGDAITTTNGWVELAAAPGSTPRSVRFTSSGSNSLNNATFVKVSNIDGYHTNLDAPSGSPSLWLNGNCVFTGLGIIDETYIFASPGAWSGGIYVTGNPVDWSAIAAGDAAAYIAAAQTKYVVFQDSAQFPFATYVKRNWIAQRTSKDCGISYDRYVANGIDTTIDATGSAFHADVQHLIGAGGDINLHVHGMFAPAAEAQSWFSRNGAADQDNPDCNISFINYVVRKVASGFNAQWQRSASNISFVGSSLPNEALLILSNFEDPAARMSYVTIRQTVLAAKSFADIGAQGVDVVDNHFADGVYGTDCTAGGTETDWWTDPAANDYSVVPASDISGRTAEILTPTDVLGRARRVGGAIGAFEEAGGGDPPIVPPAATYFVTKGQAFSVNLGAQNTGGLQTAANETDTPGKKPPGSTMSSPGGVFSGTIPA